MNSLIFRHSYKLRSISTVTHKMQFKCTIVHIDAFVSVKSVNNKHKCTVLHRGFLKSLKFHFTTVDTYRMSEGVWGFSLANCIKNFIKLVTSLYLVAYNFFSEIGAVLEALLFEMQIDLLSYGFTSLFVKEVYIKVNHNASQTKLKMLKSRT